MLHGVEGEKFFSLSHKNLGPCSKLMGRQFRAEKESTSSPGALFTATRCGIPDLDDLKEDQTIFTEEQEVCQWIVSVVAKQNLHIETHCILQIRC